jgi:hypothetical protein
MFSLAILAFVSIVIVIAISVLIPIVVEVQERRRLAARAARQNLTFQPRLVDGGKADAPPAQAKPDREAG